MSGATTKSTAKQTSFEKSFEDPSKSWKGPERTDGNENLEGPVARETTEGRPSRAPKEPEKLGPEDIAALRRALVSLEGLIGARDAHLAYIEGLFLRKFEVNRLSLLNPSGNRNYSYLKLEMPAMQLECKIRRRGLFFLRQRRETMLERLARAETQQDTDTGQSLVDDLLEAA